MSLYLKSSFLTASLFVAFTMGSAGAWAIYQPGDLVRIPRTNGGESVAKITTVKNGIARVEWVQAVKDTQGAERFKTFSKKVSIKGLIGVVPKHVIEARAKGNWGHPDDPARTVSKYDYLNTREKRKPNPTPIVGTPYVSLNEEAVKPKKNNYPFGIVGEGYGNSVQISAKIKNTKSLQNALARVISVLNQKGYFAGETLRRQAMRLPPNTFTFRESQSIPGLLVLDFANSVGLRSYGFYIVQEDGKLTPVSMDVESWSTTIKEIGKPLTMNEIFQQNRLTLMKPLNSPEAREAIAAINAANSTQFVHRVRSDVRSANNDVKNPTHVRFGDLSEAIKSAIDKQTFSSRNAR